MNNQNSANQQQMQVKVSDEVLKGVYANMMQVAHTPEEFILDFMSIFPPAGIIASRVIVSPGHLKRMAAALQENLKQYEAKFGEIKAGDIQASPTANSSSGHSFGFDTNQAK